MNQLNSNELALRYKKLLQETKFVTQGPIKGTMFFGPNATIIWRNIQKLFTLCVLNKLSFKVEEVIFPTLIPKRFIEEEREHIEGFEAELWSTKRKESNFEVVLRPTSEVIFNTYVSELNLSYKNFPLGFYQWGSIFRVENNVKILLRSNEFLWQEGHTFHLNEEKTMETIKEVFEYYKDFLANYLLLPIFSGEKTKIEKFAGAKRSYGIETIMKDGQAIQIATIHNLSNNFTKIFNVNYLTSNNIHKYAYGSSWGFSSRVLGAMILMHADEYGLIFPSKIAINQVTFLAIDFHNWPSSYQEKLYNLQKNSKYGVKIKKVKKNLSSLKWNSIKNGVPLVINLGIKDFEINKTTVFLRTSLNNSLSLPNIFKSNIEDFDKNIKKLLEIHDSYIKDNSQKYWDKKINLVYNKLELIDIILKKNLPVYAHINLRKEEESVIKKKYGFSIRVLLENKQGKDKLCVFTSKNNAKLALISRAY